MCTRDTLEGTLEEGALLEEEEDTEGTLATSPHLCPVRSTMSSESSPINERRGGVALPSFSAFTSSPSAHRLHWS